MANAILNIISNVTDMINGYAKNKRGRIREKLADLDREKDEIMRKPVEQTNCKRLAEILKEQKKLRSILGNDQ